MTAESIKPTQITKPRRKVKPADKEKVVKLAIGNDLSCRQVEALTGVSKSVVAEILQDAKQNPETIQFSKSKDKVYEGLQYRLVNLADDEALKSMLSKRGLTDLGILEDKIRLIRGESTANVAYDARIVSTSIAELRQMLKDNGVIDADP